MNKILQPFTEEEEKELLNNGFISTPIYQKNLIFRKYDKYIEKNKKFFVTWQKSDNPPIVGQLGFLTLTEAIETINK